VDFFDGATLLGTATLNGGGVATLTTSALGVGIHSITAAYSGDADFMGSAASATTTTTQAATITTLTAAPDPSVFGQAITLTASVSAIPPGAGTPTGTVSFFDGAALLGTGTLGGGVATLTSSSLTVGSHSLTAVYSGDADFTSSTSPVDTTTTNQADTTTALSATPDPSVLGQPVTLTATVSAVPPGSGTPTGTVSFFDGATLLGTATLSGGVATFTTSALSVGSHAFTAVYGGDSDFAGSTSPVDITTTTQAATSTNLTAAPDPSSFGQLVTLTATVTAVPPGSGIPTGTADFFDGATLLGTGTLSGGVATFTSSALAVGSHSLTAVYSGDSNLTGSTSPVDTITVNQAATTTTVTAAPNPSVFGQAVTLSATVSAIPPGSGTPTGTVSFFDGATLLGTATLVGGVAIFTTSALAVGTHSITAVYSGDADFMGSAASATTTTTQAATITTLTAAPDPSSFGQPVTFTASVSAVPPGAGIPSGTVSFFDGATLLGTATVNGSGVATLSAAAAIGSHSLTAVYSGDINFTGSASPVTTTTVNQAAANTILIASPNPAVVGQAVTFTATVSAVAPGAGTPTGTVSFFDGPTLLGTGTVNGSGVATLSSVPALGSHSLTAVYSGDGNFTGSTSFALTLTVVTAGTGGAPSTGGGGFIISYAATSTATNTATASPTPVTSTATATQSPVPTNTVVPTIQPTATATEIPTLVVHNSPRTIVGGGANPCTIAGNTNGKKEPHCEIVSSISAPGASVTYTLKFANGTTLTFDDTADKRGHSLHPFAVSYLPARGSKHGQPSTVARIVVTAKLTDGATLGPVTVRFAVIR
jgi:hypothetical protein